MLHDILAVVASDVPLKEILSLTVLPHGFAKHSREQYEKLSTMHKNMQKLYESLGSYYAYDPHAICVEDFFGYLANFRSLFMVSPCPATPVFSSSLSFLHLFSFFSLSLSLVLSFLLSLCLSLFIRVSFSQTTLCFP